MNRAIMWILVLAPLAGAWFLRDTTTIGAIALGWLSGFLLAFATLREMVQRGIVTVTPTGRPQDMARTHLPRSDEEE